MSIQSTSTATVSASSSASSSAPATNSSSTTSASSSTSFQDELQSANSSSSTAKSDTTQKTSASDNSQAAQQAEVSKENETKDAVLLQQLTDAKEQATVQNQKGNQVLSQIVSFHASEISKDVNPYDVLNTELRTINNLKNNLATNPNGTLTTGLLGSISVTDETSDTAKDSKKIGLDEQDSSFYLGMINNQQIKLQLDAAASSSVGEAASKNNNNYTLVQSDATQQTVKVSSVLMDALADSMKNNKTVRVDFGGDIAVVMKVDKQGVLSANFIPSTAAVENYLKNNIASLRQNFDSQNLAYNDLSYSEQQKKGQNDNQRESKNKEKDNE